ncbi:hypothetical protein [Francisella philomiragia]|uniref:hypothetical protein n=1 Tax=Francisella philomiragia TaxID=28110 RepID=UPI0009BB1462
MISVVCYTGIIGSGNYYNFSISNDNKWFLFDDSTVKFVEKSDVTRGYILLYELE